MSGSARAAGALLALALLSAAGCAAPITQPSEALVDYEQQLGEGPLRADDEYPLRWQAARAALDQIDDPSTPAAEKVSYARKALDHAEAAAALAPERVEGHFYTAVAIGRVLELSAVPNPSRIGELEAAGLRAKELDPSFRCAGPLRLLALLYHKAPAWPLGPEDAGEEDVIEGLLTQALELAPECVENRVAYAEFLADVERRDEALAQAQRALALLCEAGHTPELPSWERRELDRRARDVLASR